MKNKNLSEDEFPVIDSPGVIKALATSDGATRVGGYLVVFGHDKARDLSNEYFTKNTKFYLDWYTERPMLYHHALDKNIEGTPVGVIRSIKADEIGLYAEADIKTASAEDHPTWDEEQISNHNKWVNKVLALIQKGVLGWSSGSLPTLARKNAAGAITKWPIVEGSATPSPCEPRLTTIGMMKTAYKAVNIDDAAIAKILVEDELAVSQGAKAEDEPLASEDQAEDEQDKKDKNKPTENGASGKMDMELIKSIAISAVEAYIASTKANLGDKKDEVIEGAAKALAEQVTGEDATTEDVVNAAVNEKYTVAIKSLVDAVNGLQGDKVAAAVKANLANRQAASKVTETASSNKGTRETSTITVKSKYSDLSAADMSFYSVLRNVVRKNEGLQQPWTPDQAFYRELADKATKAYQTDEERERLNLDADAITAVNAIKSDELDYSTQAGFGDEWVPTLWTNQLWARVRLDNIVAPLFNVIEMPSNPYIIPLETTDPTVYKVAETTNESSLLLSSSASPIPDSKMATAQTTITAAKLGLRVGFSTELEEDSIIPWTSQLRKQALRAMADTVDNVLLNGDTTNSSANINNDSAVAATDKFMVFNGIIYNALIAATAANAYDNGGLAPSLQMARTVRFKMQGSYALRPQDIAYITDVQTYAKFLGLQEFLTMDKAGALATNQTGQLGVIDASPLLVSAELSLAKSNGKVSNTGGSNTLGRFIAVYRPGWYVGYRRRVTLSIDFLPYLDSYQLTSTMRLGFINRDTEVSAISYNIGV